MLPELLGAAFFAWSRSRLNLTGAGVDSETPEPEPPKKVAAPQHCLYIESSFVKSNSSFAG